MVNRMVNWIKKVTKKEIKSNHLAMNLAKVIIPLLKEKLEANGKTTNPCYTITVEEGEVVGHHYEDRCSCNKEKRHFIKFNICRTNISGRSDFFCEYVMVNLPNDYRVENIFQIWRHEIDKLSEEEYLYLTRVLVDIFGGAEIIEYKDWRHDDEKNRWYGYACHNNRKIYLY